MLFDMLYIFVGMFLAWFFVPTPAWGFKVLAWLVKTVPFLKQFVKTDVTK